MKIKNLTNDVYKGKRVKPISEPDSNEIEKNVYIVDTGCIEYGLINYNKIYPCIISDDLKEKFILRNGDIIINTRPGKDTKHVAFVDNLNNKKLVPNSDFIIIRNIDNEKYLPEYVAIYLENNYIKILDKPAISIMDIEDTELPSIDIQEQKKIINIIGTINRKELIYKNLLSNENRVKKIFNKQFFLEGKEENE